MVAENAKTTWVIGDIHGMCDPLRALINRLDNDYLDKFVFVGDYIDHGPSSKDVLDVIMGLGDKAVTLMGNHEHLLMQTLFDQKFQDDWGNRIWEENGAESTLNSFGLRCIDEFGKQVDPRYTDFLTNLQCFYQKRFSDEAYEIKFLITHGGIMPTLPLADQLAANSYQAHNELMKAHSIWIEDSFVWIRSDFFQADPNHWEGNIVIHGHTPTHILDYSLRDFDPEKDLEEKTQIYIRQHPDDDTFTASIDIDTGAAFGKRLTAVGLNQSALEDGWFEIEVLQVKVNEGYYRAYPFEHNRIAVQATKKDISA